MAESPECKRCERLLKQREAARTQIMEMQKKIDLLEEELRELKGEPAPSWTKRDQYLVPRDVDEVGRAPVEHVAAEYRNIVANRVDSAKIFERTGITNLIEIREGKLLCGSGDGMLKTVELDGFRVLEEKESGCGPIVSMGVFEDGRVCCGDLKGGISVVGEDGIAWKFDGPSLCTGVCAWEVNGGVLASFRSGEVLWLVAGRIAKRLWVPEEGDPRNGASFVGVCELEGKRTAVWGCGRYPHLWYWRGDGDGLQALSLSEDAVDGRSFVDVEKDETTTYNFGHWGWEISGLRCCTSRILIACKGAPALFCYTAGIGAVYTSLDVLGGFEESTLLPTMSIQNTDPTSTTFQVSVCSPKNVLTLYTLESDHLKTATQVRLEPEHQGLVRGIYSTSPTTFITASLDHHLSRWTLI